MGRARRAMPFLQRRDSSWYFRFRLPRRLQSLVGRAELRISLSTRELAEARKRVEGVLIDVYAIKQLARRMSELEPAHVQKALDTAFSDIVEKLERSKEPWLRERARAPFGFVTEVRGVTEVASRGTLAAWTMRLLVLKAAKALDNGQQRGAA